MAKKVQGFKRPQQCCICGEIFHEQPYIDGEDIICGRCHFEMQMGVRERPKKEDKNA